MSKKNWSYIFSVVAIVGIIALVLAVGGAFSEKILGNKSTVEIEKLKIVMPEATSFEPEEYMGDDENIKSVIKTDIGYVVQTVTYGYAGNVTLLTGVGNDGKVTGTSVISMSETPGLGAQAKSLTWFSGQFVGKDGAIAVGEGIDAIAGATVTSKAVTKGVNSAIAFVSGADIESSATEWES